MPKSPQLYGPRTSLEKIQFYRRGFSDGASSSAQACPKEPSYLKGYEDGRLARVHNIQVFCEEIDYYLTEEFLEDDIYDGS